MDRSRRNAYAALSLDRASALLERPGALESWRADPAARLLLIDSEARVEVGSGGRLLRRPLTPQIQAEQTVFLGLDAGSPLFAARGPVSGHAVGLREAAMLLPAAEASLFAYARALLDWQDESRHCGRCGAPTRPRAGGRARRCSAEDCRRDHFPRTDPCIIVLVEHAGRCLLGRQSAWPSGRFSSLAGFVEPGETLEDAVRREVAEESGVRVGACRYHSSQPWPFPGALMIGFHAEARDPRLALGEELAEAEWFAPEALCAALASGRISISPPLSIAHQLISAWVEDRGLRLPGGA